MILSVSNDGIQWTLDFGPDSVTFTIKDLDQKNNNQLTKNTPGCLAFADVSKTRLFEQSSSANSNYSQPGGNNGDETRSTLQCGGSRIGQ